MHVLRDEQGRRFRLALPIVLLNAVYVTPQPVALQSMLFQECAAIIEAGSRESIGRFSRRHGGLVNDNPRGT
jgi:hypothetical protein